MQRCTGLLYVLVLLCLPVPQVAAEIKEQGGQPVAATVVTTLATEGKQIRMFAFDSDPNTYFASAKNAAGSDHFTLVLDKPVALKSLAVTTGRPDGANKSSALVLQVSSDGKTFEEIAKFKGGTANATSQGRQIVAVRIKPTADLGQALVIREIAIDSNPKVATFKYPVEFILNVSDAPEMKEWAESVAKVCERAYQWMGDELRSPGYKPPTVVTMTLKSDYNGVAATSGARITGSVAFFKRKPDDVGAMVHETVHVQQQYKGRGNPGWLVEGIADYIRFFKYEPGKIGNLNVAKAKYNGSYRVTARFLAYVTDKYKKDFVLELNRAMREGRYKEEMWKDLTGKPLQELDEEWRASLKKTVPGNTTRGGLFALKSIHQINLAVVRL
jgi:hypothetical protein